MSAAPPPDRSTAARDAAAVRRDLVRIVGDAHVLGGDGSTIPVELLRDATEARGTTGDALAVVRPGDADEVAAVVRWAGRHGMPLVPRGGGTGFSGGAVPDAGSVVLATDRLTGPGEIVPEDWSATFPAGVVTADLQRRCLEAGLFFAPNPGSAESSLIGGNVATNAGGPRSFRYGPVRAWLTGVDAVLGDGERIRAGGTVRKNVETLDLLGLLCGSEGTLGVITGVSLKLLPAPEVALPILACYPHRDAGLAALAAAMACGVVPAALEFLDGATLRAAAASFPGGLPDGAAFAVLAEALGPDAVAHAEGRVVADALTPDALAVHAPTDRRDVDALWRWRDGVSIAVTAARGGKLSEDLAVPASRLCDILAAVDRVAGDHGVEVCSWGHAGDGNLHATVMVDRTDPAALRRAEDAAHAMLDLPGPLGGVLTAEHGVGTVKRDAAARLDPTVLATQAAIKDVLDPAGIMNPGKKLPAR
ncbi:MAG: FAD-binding oxidoreductase [Solirubrobacteraceae bacterium]|nr:FAD-binding oxidoreductase [Solirubrobacteraceae bacterium]